MTQRSLNQRVSNTFQWDWCESLQEAVVSFEPASWAAGLEC